MDVILGTAGHIDHGKTTLVRALTGINCDRLDEEKRRGITIELGFAWMDLPDGRRLGIVDVPGHERFVKNMVAGASGIDCVMLVIAADEGVMPQTREHLEICSLLGVRTGLVALTKVDQVDSEWLQAVLEEIRATLAPTFLAGAPIIPVSAVTGEGLDALRNAIIKLTEAAQPVAGTDIFRLPVDRVFSMKGFGTVVTGTIVSGACDSGEKVCLVPTGKESKVRNLQVHNAPVETAHKGQRCAINLQGLEVSEIQRGDVVARPDSLFPAQSWFVRLHCLESSPLPIRQRMEAHFHHGSGQCLAKIIFRDREKLEPGQTALAEVKFTSPLAAVYGDHCVLRAHSPLRAIGGGKIINPWPPLINKRKKDFNHKYALLEKLGTGVAATPTELVNITLQIYPAPGLDVNHLRVLTALPDEELRKALASLAEKKEAFCWDTDYWISDAALQACLEQCRKRAEDLHGREPLKSFFAPNALAAGWGENLPEKFTQATLELAVNKGILEQAGSGLKLAQHKISFDAKAAKMLAALQKKIAAGGMMPPFIKEICETEGWDNKKLQPLLNYLCENGEFVKIQDGVYYNAQEFAKIVAKIKSWFETNDELEVGNLKNILGISRKYAIPVLEYLDNIRMTVRVDNKRRLRKLSG